LSDKLVARIVKRRAAAVGLDPERYAGHSLRAGLATSAAAGGASERVIMAQTGHRSADMVRRYIREGNLLQGEWTDLEEGGIPVVRPHGGRLRNVELGRCPRRLKPRLWRGVVGLTHGQVAVGNACVRRSVYGDDEDTGLREKSNGGLGASPARLTRR